MAHIKLSDVFAKAEFSQFGGIDLRKINSGVENISDIKNFRITEGGYLKKREGLYHVMSIPSGTIRAVYVFSPQLIFAITRDTVYRVNTKRVEFSEVIKLAESDRNACFFMHDNSFYLIDGNELYLYKDDTFVVAEGYIPLYANGWSHNAIGEVYEQPNCLTDKLRLRYKTTSSTFTITLPFAISSIVAAFRNNVMIDASDIRISSSSSMLTVTSSAQITAGDTLELVVIPKTPLSNRSDVTNYTRATAFGAGLFGPAPSSLALYGGNDPSLMITTRQVSEENLAFSKRVLPDSSSMYFVSGDEINPNHGREEVTAAICNKTSLVAFTTNSACIIDEDTNSHQSVIPLSQTLGCAVRDGVTHFEDKIVTISSSGFYIWDIDSDSDKGFSSTCISTPVASLLPSSNKQGFVYYYKPSNELWFYRHGDERVFIYNTVSKCFYCFTGFDPYMMLELNEKLVCMNENTFYYFRSDMDRDYIFPESRPIIAELHIPYLNFGDFNRRKRLSRIICKGSPNASLEVSVTDSDGNTVSLPLADSDGREVGHYEKRLPCRRSRYYSIKLIHAVDETNVSVMNLALTAVK